MGVNIWICQECKKEITDVSYHNQDGGTCYGCHLKYCWTCAFGKEHKTCV